MTRTLEIRAYTLKPGARETLHRLFVEQALPMLRRSQVDVVSYGPSLHDENGYYLIRAFASLEDREQTEDAFYGSDDWGQGPREAILACIESYMDTVIAVDESVIQGLRG
jgi:hypothetical protein